MVSFERSRMRHFSTASVRSALALLISVWEILRPISLQNIIERLRVLIPARNIRLKSRLISFFVLLAPGDHLGGKVPLTISRYLDLDLSKIF